MIFFICYMFKTFTLLCFVFAIMICSKCMRDLISYFSQKPWNQDFSSKCTKLRLAAGLDPLAGFKGIYFYGKGVRPILYTGGIEASALVNRPTLLLHTLCKLFGTINVLFRIIVYTLKNVYLYTCAHP